MGEEGVVWREECSSNVINNGCIKRTITETPYSFHYCDFGIVSLKTKCVSLLFPHQPHCQMHDIGSQVDGTTTNSMMAPLSLQIVQNGQSASLPHSQAPMQK